MSRTVNQEKTKEQKSIILNNAIKLFAKKGYETTSLDEIIKEAGISKGTFYHYFTNKEDLLDYFFVRMNEDLLPKIMETVNNDKLDALSKFNKIIQKIKIYKVFHRHAVKTIGLIMYDKNNIKLKYKFIDNTRAEYLPIFTQIIEQGKKEEIFDVYSAEDAAEIILSISVSAGDSIMHIIREGKLNLKTIKLFLSKAKSHKEAIKRVLGLKKGKIDMYDKSTLSKIMSK